MLCSRGQRLLMMDADGATKVSDLERLEAKLADIASERLRCRCCRCRRCRCCCCGAGPQQAERDCRERIGTRLSATTLPPVAAGHKEDPVSSPAAGNGKRAAAGATSSGGLGFVLGSRAHMQVRDARSPPRLPACLPARPCCPDVQPPAARVSDATPPCHLLASPSHLSALLPAWLQDTATAKRSAVRNFLMHGFHLLVMMVVGHQIRDTQCGFKVWRTGLLRECCWAAAWPVPAARLVASVAWWRGLVAAVVDSVYFCLLGVLYAPNHLLCVLHHVLLQLFTRSAAQQLYSNQRLQRWCFDVELVYLAQQLKVGGGAGVRVGGWLLKVLAGAWTHS